MTYKTNWLRGILAPMLVTFSAAAVAVPATMAAGTWHTMFIHNGNVYGMGQNAYGEVSPGTGSEHRTPIFTGVKNVASIHAAYYRTAFLKKDGTALINGINWMNRTADSLPIPASGITDVSIGLRDAYYISGGKAFNWTMLAAPVAVAGADGVKHVAAGARHAVFLFNDGTVGTVGGNAYGQVGNGTLTATTTVYKWPGITNAVEVAAGEDYTVIRLADGTIKAAGRNEIGQFGLSTKDNKTTPVDVPVTNVARLVPGSNTLYVIKTDNTVWGSGWHNYIEGALYNVNTNFVQLPVGTVVDASAGMDFFMADKGRVNERNGWGGNLFGKLGDGTNTERHNIVPAFFTPIVEAVPVVTAPVVEPVVEKVIEPVTEEVVDTAIANPLVAEPTPVIEPTPVPTVTEIVVEMVVDAVVAVVDAVVAVVDAVVEAIVPTEPVVETAPVVEAIVPTAPVVTAPVVEAIVPTAPVVTAPVVTAPVVTAPVVDTKVKCNNGWGNGDQCAAGKSGSKNQAENAVVAKADPTKKKG